MTTNEDRDGRAQLLGAWELVGCQSIADDGTISYPLGDDALGQLIYDADGDRVSAQLVRAHQPSFAHDHGQQASAQEMCATRPNYFGYFGTFPIDAAAAAVARHLDAGWFPHPRGNRAAASVSLRAR